MDFTITPLGITEKMYVNSIKNYYADKSDLFYYNQANSIEMVLRAAFGILNERIEELKQAAK